MKMINSAAFEAVKQDDIALVDFSATWCGPCKMLAPVLDQLSQSYEGKVNFYKVDVDESPDLAAQFNVMSVPCVVLLKKGVFASQSIGFRPAEQMREWIDANI